MGKTAKYHRLMKAIRDFCRAEGLPHAKGYAFYAPMLEAAVGIETPPDAGTSKKEARERCYRALVLAEGSGVELPKKGKKVHRPKPSPDPIKAFYASYEWRKVRYQILEKYDPVCMLCGATRADGVRMHVDHIKPLRFFWDLRLDPDNLQVLCEICNHGKGNWDRTDHRPAS